MITSPKKLLIFYGILGFIVLVFLILLISSLFRHEPENTVREPLPSPTPIATLRSKPQVYSPAEKTEVGKTTAAEIEKSGLVISKKAQNSVTIYTIKSASPGVVDEIQAERGIVVSERMNTFNKKYGSPPKFAEYKSELGQPTRTLDKVSPLGSYITAYLYPEKGVTFFVNRYTDTVYQIQEYVPMSADEYVRRYGAYIQPAPDYPHDYFR